MRERATLAVTLAFALAGAACGGGAESNVVNQYFTALRANDTNTLTSFAMVQFDQKVDDFKITSVGVETRTTAKLPELVKKQKDLELEQKTNEKDYRAWGNALDTYPKLQRVIELDGKGAKIPGDLQAIHEKYTTFNKKNRELKKAVAESKDAVEREKRNVSLSVGQLEDVESLNGDVISKDVELNLTIGGQPKPYVMTLRKYELTGGTGGRLVSRWVVQSLTPKG
jgi:hypothetical protein